MFLYYIQNAEGTLVDGYGVKSRRIARGVKRDYEDFPIDGDKPPYKIVRREYKLIEEKVVR